MVLIVLFDLPNLTTFIINDEERDYNIDDEHHAFGRVKDLKLDGRNEYDLSIWSS